VIEPRTTQGFEITNRLYWIAMEQPIDINRRYTLEEYLALEESPEDSYEFWDGQIVPLEDMAWPPEFVEMNGKPFAVKNPRVIIEVLSPSTERNDRGPKFRRCLELESMEEYILVSQDQPSVESYSRRPDGGWLFMPVDGIERSAKLSSLGVEIPLSEIFREVSFPAGDAANA
jgi:Uma2 family endonuclease